jgi:hypothetical protein
MFRLAVDLLADEAREGGLSPAYRLRIGAVPA